MKYFVLMFLLFATVCGAQTQTQQTPSCSTPEFRQFDFWVGEWSVDQAGKPAGDSSIQMILGKCVIMENWTGRGGYSGKSFNIYNQSLKKWQQYWVDNTGVAIVFTGEFKDGAMRMQSEGLNAQGKKQLTRMIWTPTSNGLRQVWEKSDDDGKTWQSMFDGNYVRKKS